MTRSSITALIAIAAGVALLGVAGASLAKPHPPKPPKPKVTILTANEDGALRHEAIKAEVTAKRAKQVRATGRLVVDGYPDDFSFRLGPVSAKLRDATAKVRFNLSARQLEVLDFGAQTCRGATVSVSAQAGKRTGSASTALAVPSDC